MLLLLLLLLSASTEAVYYENCFHGNGQYVLKHPDANDRIRCGGDFWYCESNWDTEGKTGYFSYPTQRYTTNVVPIGQSSASNVARECSVYTNSPNSLEQGNGWRPAALQAPFNAFVNRAWAIHLGPQFGTVNWLVYFRHPDVCGGLGWAMGALEQTVDANNQPVVQLVVPNIFQAPSSDHRLQTEWLCQCDQQWYYSVFQMKSVPNIALPGRSCQILPQFSVARPPCPASCPLADNLQCNQASVRQCECSRPMLPQFAVDGRTLQGCLAIDRVVHIQAAKAYNFDGIKYGITLQPKDMMQCIGRQGTDNLLWCRGPYYWTGLTGDLCNGHGWTLMYMDLWGYWYSYPYYDCWCDVGWEGRRCNFQCYRDNPEQVCRSPNACESVGMRNQQDYSQNCDPVDPRIKLMHLRLFDNMLDGDRSARKTATSFNAYLGQNIVGYFESYQNSLWGSWQVQLRETELSLQGAQNPQDYQRPVCFLHTTQTYGFLDYSGRPGVEGRWPYFPALCKVWDRLTQDASWKLYERWKVLALSTTWLTNANYNCEQISHTFSFPTSYTIFDESYLNDVPQYQNPRNTTRRFSSAAYYNPCAWGVDPQASVPYQGYLAGSTAEIAAPLNLIYADDGTTIAHNLIFMLKYPYPDQSLLPQISQCSDPMKRPDTSNTLGLCISCNPACQAGEYCTVDNTCACKRDHTRVTGWTGCLPRFCPKGFAGRRCDIRCQKCSNPLLVCNAGTTGDGTCVCPTAGFKYNAQQKQCVQQSCLDGSTSCNGNGECIRNTNYDYCMCDRGFTGQKCATARVPAALSDQALKQLSTVEFQQYEQQFDECDCHVRWLAPRTTNRVNPLPKGFQLLSDLNNPFLAPMRRPLLGTGIVYVGNADQAKYMCYRDAYCAGFVIYKDVDYWTTSGQTNPGVDAYRVYFLQNTRVQVDSTVVAPDGVTAFFHQIDRSSLYRCPMGYVFDATWYKTAYRTQFYAYCNAEISAYNAARDPTLAAINAGFACESIEMLVKHWRYVGYFARYQPNAGCVLTPSLYDPKTYCSVSRCPNGEGVPCSGNGYCTLFGVNDYHCDCKTFNLPTETGVLGLNGRAAWMGNSCQFSVSSLCVAPGGTSLCSGNSASCQPRLAFSGDFYLAEFEAQRNDDYIPFCNCEGTPFTGTYCETSRCGVRSGGCKLVSAVGGDCVKQSSGEWKCVCQRSAIGEFCEVDASACLFNDLKCTSRGTCFPADRFNSQPYCACDDGTSGQYCQDSLCPPSVMVPGRGECLNQHLDRCYAPYTGTRCENDQCALFNGTVTVNSDNIPSGCQCNTAIGWNNTRNNQIVATCWPQCPIVGGSMCGPFDNEPHTCLQLENFVGTRTAQCQCAQGYIQVPHPTLSGSTICEKYCKHGDVPYDWTADRPSACICDPSSGFDVYDNHPRCDHPTCANDGVFDVLTQQCICAQPWSSFSRCETHTCGSRGSPVRWFGDTISPYRCECQQPFAPLLSQFPFDCSGTVCGLNGYMNPFYSAALNPALWCLCKGKFKSDCTTTPGQCIYCSISTCLNGGYSPATDPNNCWCSFPYSNGAKGICETNVCDATNTLSVEPNLCRCHPGYLGLRCETSLCRNGGRFNTETGFCDCPWGVFGIYCEVFYQDVLPFLNSTGILYFPGSSTGTSQTDTEIPDPAASDSSAPAYWVFVVGGTAGLLVVGCWVQLFRRSWPFSNRFSIVA